MVKSLSEDVHFRVLRALNESPELSQRQIAKDLGVSLGVINFCVQALVEKGQIKIQNFRSSSNKLRYAYVLTPSGVAQRVQLTASFLKRKVAEYEALKAEIAAVESELQDTEKQK
jgi:EPS-associated MarR family transcriptional regulator